MSNSRRGCSITFLRRLLSRKSVVDHLFTAFAHYECPSRYHHKGMGIIPEARTE